MSKFLITIDLIHQFQTIIQEIFNLNRKYCSFVSTIKKCGLICVVYSE